MAPPPIRRACRRDVSVWLCQRRDASKGGKRLSESELTDFEEMLRALTVERKRIATAMASR